MQVTPPPPVQSPSTPPKADSSTPAEVPEFEIRARKGWVAIDFKELLHYRELLYFLTWRDVKVRYKQTVLGFAWAILQPVLNVIIQTLIFGMMLDCADKLPQEIKDRHIPYALFNYAGILPWMIFAVGVGSGGMSLMNQQNLLTKIYFPRLFVPTSVIGAALVDSMISFCVFFVLMGFSHIAPPWTIIFIPLLLLLTTFAALGMAYALSSLTIMYRDFRFLVPVALGLWQAASPVAYPLIPKTHLWLVWVLRINPMYGIIGGYRSALLGQHWDFLALAISVVEVAGILLFGLYYFKKTERRFADIA
jgi:lipopolysaccharide transport system permease protein